MCYGISRGSRVVADISPAYTRLFRDTLHPLSFKVLLSSILSTFNHFRVVVLPRFLASFFFVFCFARFLVFCFMFVFCLVSSVFITTRSSLVCGHDEVNDVLFWGVRACTLKARISPRAVLLWCI